MSRKKYKTKPIIMFRIYGWKSSLYFRVYIWKHLKDVRREYNKNKNNKETSNGVMAFVRPISRYRIYENDKHKITPLVGEIHLQLKNLKTGVITHESVHAAIALLKRLSFKFVKIDEIEYSKHINAEELFCYTVDCFARQIVDKIYKLNILTESSLNSSLNKKKNKKIKNL